jgi:hypothetical protein
MAQKRRQSTRRTQTTPPEGRAQSNNGFQQSGWKHADPRVAWYFGLALMVVVDVIEWPIALVIGVSHEIHRRAHSRVMRELAEGVEAGG